MDAKKTKPKCFLGGGDILTPTSSTSTVNFEYNIYTKSFERVDKEVKSPNDAENEISSKNVEGDSSNSIPMCKSVFNEFLIEKLAFILNDKAAFTQVIRKNTLLKENVEASKKGFYMKTIKSVCAVLDYFATNLNETKRNPLYLQCYNALIKAVQHPVILKKSSDAHIYKEDYIEYYNTISWLLIGIENVERFNNIFNGICNILLQPDDTREKCRLNLRFCREYALESGLIVTSARMIALASHKRFKQWLFLATLIASTSTNACLKMMEENIVENIFYRFNPYFPERDLPEWNADPEDCKDPTIRLGDAAKNIHKTISLLLILIKSTVLFKEKHPHLPLNLKAPDDNALRGFIWVFRYECRSKDHGKQRAALIDMIMGLLKLFGRKLQLLGSKFMPDIMSLAILTEVPAKEGWMRDVLFKTTQLDVDFKKSLLCCGTLFLQVFPENVFMVESNHWLMGLMYLVDRNLYPLRLKWTEALYSELRTVATFSLICSVPLCPPEIINRCGIIKRLLWIIEWYKSDPYDLNLLYWNVRVLQLCLNSMRDFGDERPTEFFMLHGVNIILDILEHLSEQEETWERQQVIMARSIYMLTIYSECAESPENPVKKYKWPHAANGLAFKFLRKVYVMMRSGVHISERLLISLANMIWETIIWNGERRRNFIENQGVYKILDVLSICKFRRVQCIFLGLLSDLVLDGKALGQALTWRRHKGTKGIISVFANIFKSDLITHTINCDKTTGLILDDEFPLLTLEARRDLNNLHFLIYQEHISESVIVSHMLGKRAPKIYSILHLICDELKNAVQLIDETYNLYSSIKITTEEEIIIILASHYFVCKLGEAWHEVEHGIQAAKIQLLNEDEQLLECFQSMYRGWIKEIKEAQRTCLEKRSKTDKEAEETLYSVMSRSRLCLALDGLRELRCLAPSSYYVNLHNELLSRAVSAHIKHTLVSTSLDINVPEDVVRTYTHQIDYRNVIGQHVQVESNKQKACMKKAASMQMKLTNSRATLQQVLNNSSYILNE